MNTPDRKAAPRVGQRLRRARRGLARHANVGALLEHSRGDAPARKTGATHATREAGTPGATRKNAPGVPGGNDAGRRMTVAQRLDAMAELVEKWERRLERDGLRAIIDGEGMPMPEHGRHDVPATRRHHPRDGKWSAARSGHVKVHQEQRGQESSDAVLSVNLIEEIATESIWWLSAATDKLAAAVWRFKFNSRKDRRICTLLADGLSWREVARRAGCSKRRVARVNRQVQAWKDPDGSDG